MRQTATVFAGVTTSTVLLHGLTSLEALGAADQIVFGWSSRLYTLDTADHYSITGTAVLRHIYDPLLDITTDGKLLPALAVSWKPVGDTAWEFKLRPGVKFHNGEAFTAESVKVTLDRLTAAGSKLSKTFLFADISETEVADPFTVIVHTKGPFAPLPFNLTVIGMYPPKAIQDPNFFQKPVGSGPYTFEAYSRGEMFSAVLNRSYWKSGAASIPRVVHRFIPETATRLAGVQTGEIDVAERVPPDQVATLKKAPGVKIASTPAVEVQQWLFNHGKKPFDDQRVRNAISLAIDRTLLIRDLLLGQAQEAVSPLPPGVTGHSVFPKKKYDPAGARELLRQAGIAQGFALDFVIMNDVFVKSLEIVQVVAGMLEQVGLNLKIRNMEAAAAIAARSAGDFDMFYSGWAFQEHDPDYYYHFNFTKEGAAQMTRYNNPSVEALLEKTRVVDPVQRQKALQDVSRVLWDEEPLIWPWYTVAEYAIHDRVTFKPRSDYQMLAMGARLS